jgi:hypothetical protein
MAINTGSFPKALVGGKTKKKKEPAMPNLAQLGSVASVNKRKKK